MKFPAWVQAVVVGACLALPGMAIAEEANPYQIQEGDIVFSSSPQGQGTAVIDASGSKYTHCGVVFRDNDRWMVLEGVQPVGMTTLEAFISHSQPGTFLAKRLKTPVAPAELLKGRTWGAAQIGKDYDQRFLWDDQRMYCSELVWKIYQAAGVRLCEPKKLREYELEKPAVKKLIIERYGSVDALPLDEKVVAPGDLAVSALLVEAPRKPVEK